MGPRLESRGEALKKLASPIDKAASMGPRLESRGEPLYYCHAGIIAYSFNGAAARKPRREYLRNFNERKGLNRILRPAHSTLLLNAVVSPMQNS